MMTITDITRNVRGTLSQESCALLQSLAQGLPENGAVLDVYPGDGLSTVSMVLGLAEDRNGVRIYALDPALPTGLLSSLKMFQCREVVTPIMGYPEVAVALMNKRSMNLVVVQSPAEHVDPRSALVESITTAKYTVRKNGRVVISIPETVPVDWVRKQFPAEFVIMEGLGSDSLVVFEYRPK